MGEEEAPHAAQAWSGERAADVWASAKDGKSSTPRKRHRHDIASRAESRGAGGDARHRDGRRQHISHEHEHRAGHGGRSVSVRAGDRDHHARDHTHKSQRACQTSAAKTPLFPGGVGPAVRAAVGHLKYHDNDPNPAKWSPARVQRWLCEYRGGRHAATILEAGAFTDLDGADMSTITPERFISVCQGVEDESTRLVHFLMLGVWNSMLNAYHSGERACCGCCAAPRD